MAVHFSRLYENVLQKVKTEFEAYLSRITTDSGEIHKNNVVQAFYAFCERNGLYSSIQFAWLAETGAKKRTSTIYSYFTKLYNLLTTNDAAQTTEARQPRLTGNIAPGDVEGMYVQSGETRSVTHTGITVSGTYTVTRVEATETTGKTTVTHTELTSSTLTTITPSGRLYAYIIRGRALTANEKALESDFLLSKYPEIPSVTIGTQTWALRNCDMVATPQGGTIANVTDGATWATSQTIYNDTYAATSGTTEQKTYAAVKAAAMWCFYNNSADNGAIYGKLYNWFAVKLLQMDIDYYNAANPSTPWGWHVPTSTEFTTLANALGGASVAGGKMKLTGTNYWTTPNTGATNESGFSALSGGLFYTPILSFGYLGFYGQFWTIDTWRLNLSYDAADADIYADSNSNTWGRNLRLLKD